jgi:serine/threonine protein kinase/WD40 repeat protein
LLQAHEQAGDFLETPPTGLDQAKFVRPNVPLAEQPGDKIGHFKLLQQIGEGGCGVVYMAEQEEPVRRRVALKVIKLGMDTKSVIARFEAERQALALMDHPNIARVYDAGATTTGRPYFVMELVRGIKMTDFCDENEVPTEERLKLFIQVCQAIQHAHQKGIIHRDIKPSNILITVNDGLAVPKVIDFGIAKATQGRLTDQTLFTAFEQFLGTPAYMSPEQAVMTSLDIDTRSDIYSLGVLLYELLTSKTPFEQRELLAAGLDEMRRTIREKEPPKPSTCLSAMTKDELTTTASRRQIEPPKLIHTVRGDLDWIVMKCLAKDRTRRYETANGLARDIERHLNCEPVVARPPSRLYELQKTARRHWVGFAATVAVIAALAIGMVVSSLEAVRALRAEQEQRRLRYASEMTAAKLALDENNLGRAVDLLDRQRPGSGQRDLRGWEWRYLWQQTHSDALFTLCREPTKILSLAASADGNWLAVGSRLLGGLAVWDLRTRRMAVRLVPNEGNVHAAFSPTDPLLAFTSQAISLSGQAQNTLRLWNTATHRFEAEIPLESKGVGIAFGKDGQTLVTSTSSGVKGQITLWRVPGATKLVTQPSEQADYDMGTGFAVTPDLSLAAYVLAAGGRLRVVDLRAGKELWTAVGAKRMVTALAFSPDGKTLASGGGFADTNLRIRLWDAASGEQTGGLSGHTFWVGSLAFWPDGNRLASSSGDQTLRIWDMTTRKCLNVLRGHLEEVVQLALLPDDRTIISAAKDSSICLWDVSVAHLHQPYIAIPEDAATWCFTPDSQSVLTVNRRGQVRRWTGSDFGHNETLVETGTMVETEYRFSQNGRFLAGCSSNGVVQVWDLSRRALCFQRTNSTGRVLPIAFLDGGTKLMVHPMNGNLLQEWELTTGRAILSWEGFWSPNIVLAVSPDERTCVTISHDVGTVFRYLAQSSRRNVDLAVPDGWGGDYSPDGRLFAVGCGSGYARVWEAATLRPVATLGGRFPGVGSACFSPDAKRLGTCIGYAPGDVVKLWDVDSWQEVCTLEGHAGVVHEACFSADGNIIGVKTYGGAVHLWQAPAFAEIEAAEKAQGAIGQTQSY